jgi:hypothetical protein
MAYTYGSRQATSLQVNAGTILAPGVRRALKCTDTSQLAREQFLRVQSQNIEVAGNKFLSVKRFPSKLLKVSQKVEEKWEDPE